MTAGGALKLTFERLVSMTESNLGCQLSLSEEEKLVLADRKNKNYVEYISHIDQSELLPGADLWVDGLHEMLE